MESIKARQTGSVAILAGGIAHDFNNLLTGILGNIALAKTSLTAPGEAYKRLEQAEKATLVASNLTYQLLSFAERGEPLRTPTAIGGLIRDAAQRATGDSKVTCDFSIPDDLSLVAIDSARISFLIQDMVSNAREAMPQGGVISIEARNCKVTKKNRYSLRRGDYVRISIGDQGKGIPREHIERIFDPYYTTKERSSERGTGLGLAICYAIVSNHEGSILVESGQGAGTTFHIYLPTSGPPVKRRPGRKTPVDKGHKEERFTALRRQVSA